MRGMTHNDPIETAIVTHAEGNEGEKIGVKRGFGAFYGPKLLKRQGEAGLRLAGNGSQDHQQENQPVHDNDHGRDPDQHDHLHFFWGRGSNSDGGV